MLKLITDFEMKDAPASKVFKELAAVVGYGIHWNVPDDPIISVSGKHREVFTFIDEVAYMILIGIHVDEELKVITFYPYVTLS